MHVRLLTTPTHHYSSVPWPAVGGTIDVPASLAEYMVARGEAEVVHERPAPETAAVAPTERAVKPKARARRA